MRLPVRPLPRTALLLALLALTGCDNGNLKTASAGKAPPAPPVRAPFFDPFASPGQAPATQRSTTGTARSSVRTTP